MESLRGLSNVEKVKHYYAQGGIESKDVKLAGEAIQLAEQKGYTVTVRGTNPQVQLTDTAGKVVLNFFPCFTTDVSRVVEIINRLPECVNVTETQNI